jgi:hypothetical protein
MMKQLLPYALDQLVDQKGCQRDRTPNLSYYLHLPSPTRHLLNQIHCLGSFMKLLRSSSKVLRDILKSAQAVLHSVNPIEPDMCANLDST